MNMNSVEAQTIKAMIVDNIAEKVNKQKGEVPMSNQIGGKAKEAMSSQVLDFVNNTYSVEGHLQKWRGTTR